MPYICKPKHQNVKKIFALHSNQLFTKVSGSSLDAISETAIHTSVEQLTVQAPCFSEIDAIWLQSKFKMQNGCSLISVLFKSRQNLIIWSPVPAVYSQLWMPPTLSFLKAHEKPGPKVKHLAGSGLSNFRDVKWRLADQNVVFSFPVDIMILFPNISWFLSFPWYIQFLFTDRFWLFSHPKYIKILDHHTLAHTQLQWSCKVMLSPAQR